MSICSTVRKIGRFFTDPDYRFVVMASRGYLHAMPAQKFLKRMYFIRMGKPLNLEKPTTYTEKLQWLKLYDCKPEYTVMVDKYAVKQYVADKVGEEYVVPLLGVWDDACNIDFNTLPQRFVLKTTHDSGSIVICKNKSKLDVEASKRRLQRSLNRNYYACNREWPYKNVPRRIIAEEYMEDTVQGELRDYKFFTFGGVPKVLYIAQGRGLEGEIGADFFDMDFNRLPLMIDHEKAPVVPEKPENFDLMKDLASKLSQGTPQLRVDFYEVDGRVYFGEMTFFHCSGMHPFCPESWDETFGEWVVLPKGRV